MPANDITSGATPAQIGSISAEVIATLGLALTAGEPIYLGQTNIDHMQGRHPQDYAKYGAHIALILREPDFVGINPKDQSLEYVKEFVIAGEFVKVAVRVSTAGRYYARSLYVLNASRVHNFVAKGTLKKPLDKQA